MDDQTLSPSGFTPHPEGGYEPSPELISKIRSNPHDHPTAAQDFSKLSRGRISEEQAQAIIDNPNAEGHASSNNDWWEKVGWDVYVDTYNDIAEGTNRGLGIAAEKLGFGEDNIFSDYAERADPKFDSEKGLGETIAETGGQTIPAIVGGTATGGVIGGVALGSLGATLTFEDKDNVANILEEHFPEYTPDILVINEEDSEGVAFAKHLATNLILDTALAGVGSSIGKLLGKIKGSPEKDIAATVDEVISELPQETQDFIRGGVDTSAPLAVKEPADDVAAVATRSTEELDDVLVKEATKSTEEALERAVVTGTDEIVETATPEYTRAFTAKVAKPLQEFDSLSIRKAGLSPIQSGTKQVLKKHSDEVAQAVGTKDYTKVRELLYNTPKALEGASTSDVASLTIYAPSVTRAALEALSGDLFNTITKLTKRFPEAKTEAISKAVSNRIQEFSEEVLPLYQLYRQQGSAASTALRLRKDAYGGLANQYFGDNAGGIADSIDTILDDIGIGLFDDEAVFVTKKFTALKDAGIDASHLIESLQGAFKEFEAASAGKKATLRRKPKLTPLDQLGFFARTVQTIKDLQSMQLLGQFMSTNTEILSSGLQTLLLPTLKAGGGGSKKRALREYMGTVASTSLARRNFTKSLKFGKDISDDFLLKEGSFSRTLDHEELLKKGWTGLVQSMGLRILSIAVDLSQASSAFFKTSRAYGLAYADGLEAALGSGLKGKKAREAANKYASKRFTPEGAILDEDLKAEAGLAAFQNEFDGNTLTGRLGQAVENLRNSEAGYGVVSLMSRGVLPFFRTLTTIGSRGAQNIMPPMTTTALKKFAPEGTKIAKFIDDFTGKNGETARHVALGYQRMGWSITLAGLALVELGEIELTGTSRSTDWKAKKRAHEVMPSSSIVVGDEAYDLTRMMPFSAGLMLSGVIREYQLEEQNTIKDGRYTTDDSAVDDLTKYLQAWVMTSATLLQDSGAARGVFDLVDAVSAAVTEQDGKGLKRYIEQYASQFTPGFVRMANKAGGGTQYEGYEFADRFMAAAGFKTDYKRLDIFGHDIKFTVGKGIDPSNRRILKNDDPAYREFALLNRMEGLHLVVKRPHEVFNKQFWGQLGVDTTSFMGMGKGKVPSLHELKTKSGKNAYLDYRDRIFKGRLNKDRLKASATKYGDRIDVGSSYIDAGENFEQAMRRISNTEWYSNRTLDARKKIWSSVFGVFEKQAKAYLKENIEIDPSVFENSRYGSPISKPTDIKQTQALGKAKATATQTTQGSSIDDTFALKE